MRIFQTVTANKGRKFSFVMYIERYFPFKVKPLQIYVTPWLSRYMSVFFFSIEKKNMEKFGS